MPPFIKGIQWENIMGFPKPRARKSPIIDQVMTMKLQHFTTIFFLNFCYAPELSPRGGEGESPTHTLARCWDPNMAEIITYLN